MTVPGKKEWEHCSVKQLSKPYRLADMEKATFIFGLAATEGTGTMSTTMAYVFPKSGGGREKKQNANFIQTIHMVPPYYSMPTAFTPLQLHLRTAMVARRIIVKKEHASLPHQSLVHLASSQRVFATPASKLFLNFPFTAFPIIHSLLNYLFFSQRFGGTSAAAPMV